MKKSILGLALCLMASSAALVPQAAHAGPQWCDGTISEVLSYSDGGVMFVGSWRGDWTYLCNLNSVWNGIQPGMCKNWLAQTLIAQKSRSRVIVYYNEAPACNQLPIYGSSPVPGYVRNM